MKKSNYDFPNINLLPNPCVFQYQDDILGKLPFFTGTEELLPNILIAERDALSHCERFPNIFGSNFTGFKAVLENLFSSNSTSEFLDVFPAGKNDIMDFFCYHNGIISPNALIKNNSCFLMS